MKKNMLKRSVALGMLMAFVITGSAMAEEVDVQAGKTYEKNEITVAKGEKFKNAGTVEATESITVNGGIFTNTGTINTKVLDIYGHANDQGAIKGIINATDEFIYRGIAGNRYVRVLNADVNTKSLYIVGSRSESGLQIEKQGVLNDVDRIVIENSKGGKTGIRFKGHFTGENRIKSDIILKGMHSGQDARLEIEEGMVEFNNISSVTKPNTSVFSKYKTMIQINNSSKAIIKNINVDDKSRLDLNTWTNKTDSQIGGFELNDITVGEGGKLFASIDAANSDAKITGNININLGKDAIVDFGGTGHKAWKADGIHLDADSLTIHVEDTSSLKKDNYGSGRGVYISTSSKVFEEPSRISIIADGKNNTGNTWQDLISASKAVVFTRDIDDAASKYPELLKCLPAGIKVTQEYSDIYDGSTGVTTGDCNIKDIQIIANPNVHGIMDISNNALMSWRAENDDMNRRLGELRDSTGEHGVWVRMIRGEGDYESINYNHNTYQLGYDEKLSTDKSWTVGAALTYTEGDSTFSNGSGENRHKGLVFYGSKLNDDGSYLDLVAKYARLDHEFDVAGDLFSGEYEVNGYSLSAEYGKRFTNDKGLWLEPQMQLTYGHVGSADYVSRGGMHVEQDGMESLVGRLGFRLGTDLKQGNAYVRASYLYDFKGDTAVAYTNSKGQSRLMESDLGGGWWEVGVGANINLSKASHLYFDIEKTYGGEVATPWQWNAGVRWSF